MFLAKSPGCQQFPPSIALQHQLANPRCKKRCLIFSHSCTLACALLDALEHQLSSLDAELQAIRVVAQEVLQWEHGGRSRVVGKYPSLLTQGYCKSTWPTSQVLIACAVQVVKQCNAMQGRKCCNERQGRWTQQSTWYPAIMDEARPGQARPGQFSELETTNQVAVAYVRYVKEQCSVHAACTQKLIYTSSGSSLSCQVTLPKVTLNQCTCIEHAGPGMTHHSAQGARSCPCTVHWPRHGSTC
jgi:hypothetical protein